MTLTLTIATTITFSVYKRNTGYLFILGIEAGFGNKALEKLIPTEMVVLIHSTFILSCKIWTMLQPALSLFEHLIDFKQN